jgi:hypothetical protein
VQQLLLDLLASGAWKRTFVFGVDVAQISTDPLGLYRSIVGLVFKFIAAQLPLAAPHTVALVGTFEAVVGGTPLLPKSFCTSPDFRPLVPALRRLLGTFSELFRGGRPLAEWVSHTLRLPTLVADVFGFRNCIFVVDHLDLADVTLSDCPPFDNEGMNVLVIEHFKEAMSGASFIAACRDLRAIANLFPAVAEEGTDLTEGLRVVLTLDIAAPKDAVNEFVIILDDDVEFQLVLTAKHFGGCPAFLKWWKEMNEYADLIDKATANQGDVDELRLFLNGLAGNVVKQLFVTPDGAAIQLAVRAVARREAREAVSEM